MEDKLEQPDADSLLRLKMKEYDALVYEQIHLSNEIYQVKRNIVHKKQEISEMCEFSGGHQWTRIHCSGPRDNGERSILCTRCNCSY